MEARVGPLFHNTFVRYLFALATVAGTFAIRLWLIPFTGTGAPYVLFFAAVLVISLAAGIGPGICAIVVSVPLAAYTFVTGAGYPPLQAAGQGLLFAVDGLIVVHLTSLIKQERQAVQDANQQLRLANDEITRSMARTSQLIELAPDAFFQANLDARFTDVNPAACRLLGYDRDELMGKTIFDIVPAEDADRLSALRADLLVPGRVHTAEWTLKRKDGTFVPVEVSSNILPDGRWQVFVRDVTERKRAQAALKDSEGRLTLALDSAQMGMWDLDLLTDTSVRSLRHDQIFGYSAAVPTWGAAVFMTHVVPEDRAVAEQAFERAFVSDNFDLECRIRWADESIHWISAKGRVYRNPKGDPVRMMGTVLDVTERKRFEKEQQFLAEAGAALAASLDYDQTLATVAHLVVRDFADWCVVDVIDENGTIRRLKVVSRDPSKADVHTLLEHMRIDRDRPYLLRVAFETKQSFLIEHVTFEQLESFAQGPEHLQALRGMSPTSLMGVPLLRHGRLLGVVAFISSTESRRYGQSDLRLAEALADRAAIAIENARLYRASVSAIQLRDQVLGVVAHDLRNPLSTILLQAGALKRLDPEAERRSQKQAEAIRRAATRMNRLIQDLLDVAVMESGQLTITRSRLSARELIVGAVDTQRPLASSSSLELRIDLDRDVPDIWGDRDRLLQVFENLIGNGIKFTKAGGCITVGATSRDHEVIFRVADTGSGIPPENLPHVFDRFWQATSTDRQGAGLGLPITKGIVEAHGGRIWVESTPYHGTIFSFTIPRATPEQGRPPAPSGSHPLEGRRAA
jgi:PAS domain S-box-containing protein